MFQVYSETIKNLVIIILQVYFERVFEMYVFNIYKFLYLIYSNSEAYFK